MQCSNVAKEVLSRQTACHLQYLCIKSIYGDLGKDLQVLDTAIFDCQIAKTQKGTFDSLSITLGRVLYKI
jgi:hypothetical protein